MNPKYKPAFPVATIFNPGSGDAVNTGDYWDGNGISERTLVAAIIMGGMSAGISPAQDCEHIAKIAVFRADALLAELAKK